MALDNAQSPGSSDQSRPVRVADRQARARARTAIGLEPDRDTAPTTFIRPPDVDNTRPAQWLLVVCAALLAVAVVLLVLASLIGSNSTLAGIFGTRLSVETGALPGSPGKEPALPAYLAAIPNFRLWLSDDFAAPSRIAPELAGEGKVNAAVIVDQGVYRMQVPASQLGWTLFDLGDTTSYHLETSAAVNPASPAGAAGVIARFGGPGNFYLLSVDGSGTVSVQLWLDGASFTLQSQEVIASPAGQPNRLAVEDDGSRLRFFVNQMLVAEVLEPELSFARPGIATVATAADAAVVDFDWIAIYRPES